METEVMPLGAVARGLAAGLAGTACMTAWQQFVNRMESQSGGGGGGGEGEKAEDAWQSAPAPARVAKRLIEGLFQREVAPDRIPLLTNAAHWGYGTAWGTVYALVQGTVRGNPLARGLLFGGGVWAMSYVQLVPMGLYKPPWDYAAKSLAKDLSYHVVYGVGVAGGHAALAPRP